MNDEKKPWIFSSLKINSSLMSQIEKHALRSYPKECCGFVLGPLIDAELLDEVVEEQNEADKYHQLDPQTFPRTAETYFKINALRAQHVFLSASANKRAVKVIYHSHCESSAAFSAEDTLTFVQNGILTWPCAFIVVSVIDAEIKDRKLWNFDNHLNVFVERTLVLF